MSACQVWRCLRLLLAVTAGMASAAVAFAQAVRPPAGTASAPSVRRTTITAPVVLPPPVKLTPPVTCGRGGQVSVTPC